MPEYRVELIERATGRWRTESVSAAGVDEARALVHRDGWLIGEVRQLPDPPSAKPPPPTPVAPPWRSKRTDDSLTRADLRRLRAAMRGGVWEGGCVFVLVILLLLFLVNMLVCSGFFSLLNGEEIASETAGLVRERDAITATGVTAATGEAERKSDYHKTFVESIQAGGYLGEVWARDGRAVAIVGADYYNMDTNSRYTVARHAWYYLCAGSDPSRELFLQDMESGEVVGTFSPKVGLAMR